MNSTDDRLSRIESRLETLEEALNQIILDLEGTPRAPAVAAPPPQVPLPPQTGWSGQYQMSPEFMPAPRTSVAKTKSDVNWLGIVATICFVLAGGFIVKLAVDSGWLTPERQIGLACLFGLALIGAGFWLRKLDKPYSSLLPGAGIVVLYMSFLAAHAIHFLIPSGVALALISVTSAACVAIYLQLRLEPYLITAIVGSYLSPLLLGKGIEIDFSLGYFVCCSIAFAGIGVWLERRVATLTASYLAILMTAILGSSLAVDTMVVWALAFHFLIFAGGTVVHSQRTQKPLTRDEGWAFFPVLLLFYSCEYYFINKITPLYAPWISLTFAGFLIGLYVASKSALRDATLNSKEVILAYVTVVLFHSIYLEVLNDSIRPWLLVAAVGAMIFAPLKQGEKFPDAFKFPLFAVGAITLIEYVRIASSLLRFGERTWVVVGFAAVAAFGAFYVRRARELPNHAQIGFAVLGAAHGLAILSLYRLLEPSGSLAVSAGWLAYAAVTIGAGFKLRDSILAKSALGVLALAAAKALLYDAASAPTVVRIVCLLLTGVVLFGCGLLLRKIGEWESRT